MKIHILGACGTFMAGIAYIARQLGHEVVGVDDNIYPPMSDFLREQDITLISGYDRYASLSQPDSVIIGNAMTRGNPAVEHVLSQGWYYISGPQWLYENVLRYKTVLAVSGTHGKTTTSSILTWILECAGLSPSFLIGGIPNNFGVSARLTDSPYFVIEADEYDSAFFDKRSKFLHYRPNILIVNNIEFDHADIFNSIEDIKKQFHYLLRTIPQSGMVICPHLDPVVDDVLARGLWSQKQHFGSLEADWSIGLLDDAGQKFSVKYGDKLSEAAWPLLGRHNVMNAVAAIAAAHTIGVETGIAINALSGFQNVKRRLEKIAEVGSVTIYEDFAHHPTAIRATLEALRRHKPEGRIVALLELASNSMRMGVHKETLIPSLSLADEAHILSKMTFDDSVSFQDGSRVFYHQTLDALMLAVIASIQEGDTILIMSNRDFGGIYTKLPRLLTCA